MIRLLGSWGLATGILALFVLRQESREEGLRLRREAIQQGEKGDRARAIELESQALKIFEALQDHENAAWSHNNIGFDLAALGRSAESAGRYVEALKAAGAAGVAAVEDAVLANFGSLVRSMEAAGTEADFPALFQAMLRAAADENLWGRTEILLHQRDHQLRRKDVRSAIVTLNDLVKLQRDRGSRYGEALMTHTRGALKQEAGDVDGALADFKAALEIREAIGDTEGLGWTLNNMGYALHTADRPKEALEPLNRALEKFRAIGHREGMQKALANLNMAYQAAGDDEAAGKIREQMRTLLAGGEPGRPGKASASFGAPPPVETMTPRDVLFEVTWNGQSFEFGRPGDRPRGSIGAHDQVSDAEVCGVAFRISKNRLWFGNRMIFLAKGETAEATKGGCLRLKRR